MDAKYAWHPLQADKPALVEQISEQCDLPPVLAQLLVARGCDSLLAAQQFLKPQLAAVKDPTALHDMDKAVDRLTQAIEQGEQITVYGDYDADGITSTALMYETLETVGAQVNYYVPDRFTDGYGPNRDAYQRLIDDGTQLIVTVDNGVSGKAAIDYANQRGVDVVITDHHALPAELPDAVAIVHPAYPGDEYEGGDLSGVGVAFKVAWALLGEFPAELLDLVAIGEIADVVSVAGENRILITLGLQQLRQGLRIGIHALLERAKVVEEDVTEQTIGFQLAPQLNALGRLKSAATGVELLTTLDDERADQLAAEVDECNQQRRTLVQEVLAEALAMANQPENQAKPALVLLGHNWHQGILGIVASQILGQTGKPTIVASVNDGETVAKASGRSRTGFDLFAALDGHRDLMEAFGGHELACGLSFAANQQPALEAALAAEVATQGFDAHQAVPLEIAGQLTASDLTLDFYQQLQRLAPFGPDNEQPVFAVSPSGVANLKMMGQDNQHLRFTIPGPTGPLAVVAFNQADRAQTIANGATDLAVKLDLNRWQGKTSLQLLLEDLRQEGPVITDARVQQLIAPMFSQEAVYVTFSRQLRDNLTGNAQGEVVSASEASQLDLTDRLVVIVDCPPDLASLQTLWPHCQAAKEIRLLCYSKESLHRGMPNRQQFIALYQTVKSQAVNLSRQGRQLANYLQVDNDQLFFMIRVFLELRFVTIKDGVLAPVDDPTRADLQETMSYRQRQARLEVESVLLRSTTTQLQQWVRQGLNSH